MDVLRFQEVFPLMEVQNSADHTVSDVPPMMAAMKFFMAMDQNRNGMVSFDEFLQATTVYIREEEKKDKKKSKKGKGKRKQKK
jgi:hypothetical protein